MLNIWQSVIQVFEVIMKGTITWLPIEGAPKDDTEILIYGFCILKGKKVYRIYHVKYSIEFSRWVFPHGIFLHEFTPSHFTHINLPDDREFGYVNKELDNCSCWYGDKLPCDGLSEGCVKVYEKPLPEVKS